MKVENLSSEMWALLFGVRTSIRYHDRRVRFYELMHSAVSALSLTMGSAAVAFVLEGSDELKIFAAWAGAAVAIGSAVDLVVGFSRKAWLHADLKKRFIDLEIDIVKNHKDSSIGRHLTKRRAIEGDEPPVMKVLALLCNNEMIEAEGVDPGEKVNIGFFRRLTANFIAWSGMSAVSIKDLEESKKAKAKKSK